MKSYPCELNNRFMPMDAEREIEAIGSFLNKKHKYGKKFSNEALQILLNKGLDYVQIAKKFDCNESSVRRRVKKYNLKRR